ncbi:50S ribosomal protein L5 [Candidatus Uhrbacteria bacterium CG10_big_fil_rev_8_21_14_0_10_48_11]|uniref:Large ribosomal subunit protein uL5 n=1 Tax=Candidatus Uhrbacteria bacterium CG10_big_fil_rev_8_21_14_0_10_48_11 TaxID=1975037 RepID=A0A2M8LEY9_9BACT|nr:MAG: 50S ribosomal protein L5 [Candidatus Uhrbacteria bacterium CG10_big_fil_rev_8_21_14_0_10_48_11]
MKNTETTTYYTATVLPKLMKEFGYKNVHEAPRVTKVVVHVGTGQGLTDAKFLETATETLRRITGQQPVKTIARKSISNFKIREGMVIGLKVTLRGKRMDDFLNKLVHVSLPRVRDFRGLAPSIVDKTGNATVGFKEHLVFPEIRSDEVERIHGLEVIIDTTAKNREEGMALLTALGFPFHKD